MTGFEEDLTKEGRRRLDAMLSAFRELGKKLDVIVKSNERVEKAVGHLIALLEEEALPDTGELIEEIQRLRKGAENPLSPLAEILRGLRR